MIEDESKPHISAQSFIRKLVGFSLATWISFAISLIIVPITTRLFMPDQLGVINMYSTVSNFLLMFVYLGLDQAYVRFFYEPPNQKKYNDILLFCLLVTGAFAVTTSIIASFFSSYISLVISGTVHDWIIACLSVSIIASVVMRFLNLTFRMQQDVMKFTVQSVLIVVVGRVLYLAAALYEPNYQNAIILMTIGQGTLMLVYMLIQRKEYMVGSIRYSRAMSLELFKFALPILPLGIIVWLNNSIALLMLRAYVDFTAIGIYTIAAAIAGLISLLQAGFNTYWAAFVYENYKTENEKIKKIHNLITFAMVLFGMLLVVGQDIIFIIVGEQYLQAKYFFPFLLIAPIAYTISETTGLGINISKRTYLTTSTIAITAGTNALLCILIMPYLEITGAAVASAIAAIIMLYLRTGFGEKYYRSMHSIWPMSIALGLMVTIAITNVLFYEQIILKYSSFTVLITLLFILYWQEAIYITNTARKMYVDFRNRRGRDVASK